MSSFTSNSEQRPAADARSELKALAVLAVVLLLAELLVRFTPPRRIGDHAMLRSFEPKAHAMADLKGTRAILMGNSLTRNGYDIDAFNAELKSAAPTDPPFHAEVVALYGSSLTEWYHIFKRDFAAGETDAVVINLSPGAAQDEMPVNVRVAWLAEESHPADVPEIVRKDLSSFEDAGEFLQSLALMTYAYRADLRYDVLSRVVPKYWDGVQWVNEGLKAAAEKHAQAAPASPVKISYEKLDRLATLAASRHVGVLLVAMPVVDHYDIDPDLIAFAKRKGIGFMDCRTVPGLTPAHYKDGWHLNADGGAFFSRYMAHHLPQRVAELLATLPRAN